MNRNQFKQSALRAIALGLVACSVAFPVNGFAGVLTGVKFNDLNANGILDGNEPVFVDHVIQITYINADDSIGNRWDTKTDQNGQYRFDDLNSPGGGRYRLSTGTPVDENGERACFTGVMKTIEFSNSDTVDWPLAFQLPCNNGEPIDPEPALVACTKPTISSVNSGDWNDPNVWEDENGVARLPSIGDTVLINKDHILDVHNISGTSINVINVEERGPFEAVGGALCNAGTLSTPNGEHRNCGQAANISESIEIQAMYVVNYATGVIKTGNGGNAPSGAGHPCPKQRCGEGQNATGGKAGDITIIAAKNIINDGLIIAGNGGNAGAAHGIASGGNGGQVLLQDNELEEVALPNHLLSRTQPVQGGDGGKICAPHHGWQVRYLPRLSTPGLGGDVIANLSVLEGRWTAPHSDGDDGTTMYYDPLQLKPSTDFSISGYERAEIYTDAGGLIDFTQLQVGAISAEYIRVFTKSLNGEGGVLDLTGVTDKIFVAATKVEIYADNIKTDPNINIKDLIDAPDVVISAGKIPSFVSVTSEGLVIGQPDEKVQIRIQIRNIASNIDTYNVNVADSLGWQLGSIPDVTLEGYEGKDVYLDVTLPNKRGAFNTVKVTVTSQAMLSTQKTVEIRVEVDAGPDSDGDTYPDSLDAFPNDETEWLDTDGDGIGNNTDTDDDDDGMLDVWESQYELLSPAMADADEDVDDDGFSNLEEYKENTDPMDPTSKPIRVVDVWVSDPSPDDGTEPGKATHIWASPDVWVRNQDDDGTYYQNVKYGQDNYVYVNVRNRGNLVAQNTKIEVFRSRAGLGQSRYRGWGLVGTAEIDSLAPQASKVVKIKWLQADIPNPGHYCFYVVLTNDQDPLFTPETSNMVQNTRNNNNIAWRNFNVVGFLDKVVDTFEVEVGNPTDSDVDIELRFEEKEAMLQADGAKAIVNLGDILGARWIAAGAQGENIKALGGNEVELLATPAKLIGIPLKVDENLPITMRVEITKPMPGAGTSREYIFSAQEFINGELVGGVDYSIITRAQDTDSDGDGIKDIVDDDNDNDGMPDDWEIENDLNPLNANDADGDADGDGYTNKAEYEQGTDPNDSTSVPANGVVRGVITDKQGNPVADVVVTVDGQTVTTDSNGEFEISGLPADREYTITATKDGIQFPIKTCEVGTDQDCEVSIKAGSLLSLNVSTEPRYPEQGQNVIYNITVHNQGAEAATNVVLTIPVPDNTTLVSLDGDMTCQDTTCTIGEIAAGERLSLSMEIVNKLSTQLTNTVTLQSDAYPTETIEKKVYVKPYLSVARASNNEVITQGDTFSLIFRVAVNNYAPEAAQNIQFKTELARGYELLGVTGADCDTSNLPILVCQMGTMAVGESRNVKFDLRLDDFFTLWASHRGVVKADNYPAAYTAISTKVYLGDALVDIVVAIDVTGSMHDEIVALDEVMAKLEQVLAQHPTAQPMIAVVSFRDDIYLEVATTHIDEVRKAISTLEAKGGGACPEASYEAMTMAVEHASQGATIILVTDAPSYDDVDMNKLIDAINAKEIKLFVANPKTLCSPIDGWDFQ